jgi:hypothetical protein
MAGSSGKRELGYSASIDIADALKKSKALIAAMNDLNGSATKAFKSASGAGMDTKGLTAYQQEILKIKKDTLDLARQKQEQAAADRSASLAFQASLREERQIKQVAAAADRKEKQDAIVLTKQLADEANKRKPTQVSNSQAEIDAYNRAQRGSMLYTSAINAEIVAKARLNTETAKQAIANGGLSPAVNANSAASKQQTAATNGVTLSKKQLAQMLAEEKYRQQQSTAELKNNSREMLNVKDRLNKEKRH